MALRSQLRRRCCCSGPQLVPPRTRRRRPRSLVRSRTPSGSPDSDGRQHALKTQPPTRGGSESSTRASHPGHRRRTGDAQALEGSTAKPWVPRPAPEVAKVAPLTPVKSRRRSLFANSDNTKVESRTRGLRSQAHALCVNLTHTRTIRAGSVHDSHARHVGRNSGGGKTHERRATPTAPRTTDRAREPHLEDAEDDLKRVLKSNGRQTPATRKKGPRRGSTARA